MLNIFVLRYLSKNVTTTKYQIALIKQNAPCRTHLFFIFSFLYEIFLYDLIKLNGYLCGGFFLFLFGFVFRIKRVKDEFLRFFKDFLPHRRDGRHRKSVPAVQCAGTF